MNKLSSPLSVLRHERLSLTGGDADRPHPAGATPAALNDLIHEVRQPLGIIETLAYYLELKSADEDVCARLQQIQSMVCQVHHILERAATA